MDKMNQPHHTKLTRFLALFLEQDMQTTFSGKQVPAILIRHAQEFVNKYGTRTFAWYVGKGYQLWDTKDAKDIFVLARNEDDAFDKFYLIFPCELEHIEELPDGCYEDYDPEQTDDGEIIEIEFTFHSLFTPSPLDFTKELWDES